MLEESRSALLQQMQTQPAWEWESKDGSQAQGISEVEDKDIFNAVLEESRSALRRESKEAAGYSGTAEQLYLQSLFPPASAKDTGVKEVVDRGCKVEAAGKEGWCKPGGRDAEDWDKGSQCVASKATQGGSRDGGLDMTADGKEVSPVPAPAPREETLEDSVIRAVLERSAAEYSAAAREPPLPHDSEPTGSAVLTDDEELQQAVQLSLQGGASGSERLEEVDAYAIELALSGWEEGQAQHPSDEDVDINAAILASLK